MKISEPGQNERRVLTMVLVVIGLLLSMGAVAQAQDEEADKDYWVQRYETLVSDLDAARARVELSQLNYTRARTRNYPRGEALLELEVERDKAELELAKLEEEFEAFPDEARRAGALPGWFRDLD
jgi:hypothetical protein